MSLLTVIFIIILLVEGSRAVEPNTQKKWKPIDDRKFGHDVSVRKPIRTDSISRIKKTLIEYFLCSVLQKNFRIFGIFLVTFLVTLATT